MIRRKGPILAVAVIAAFALGWYRGLFGVESVPQTEAPRPAIPNGATPSTPAPQASSTETGGTPTAPSGNSSQASSETASGAAPAPDRVAGGPASGTTPQPEGAASDVSPAVTAPGFDVVRVEPDGSTVVAGKGKANEAIALTDGTRTLSEARTDANGDFVMSLSLPQGSHRLQLAQRDDTVSDDAAVVNVPPTGKPGELLVMMQRPGEASEIIQRPSEQAAVTATSGASTPTANTPADTQRPADTVAATAPTSPELSNVAGTPDMASPQIGVDAVEIEGDRLFVAGSAKERTTVRVYLDDQPIAEATSGAGERYIASARADVAVGEHTIRVDALDATGRVVSRVEVPFQRPEGNAMAAIAAPPQPEGENSAAPGSSAADAPVSLSTDIAPGGMASMQPGSVSPSGTGSLSTSSPLSAPSTAQSPASVEPSRQAGEATPNGAAAPTDDAASGSEPPTVRQAPLEAAASRVIIRRGDTLWGISRETYGRGSRYTVIYLANGDQIRNPDRIYPGQVFRVPDAAATAEPPRG